MIERPIARYGRVRLPRRWRRWVIAGLTVLVLLAGVLIAVVGYRRLGPQEVAGALTGYHVVDDRTVEVTITVTRTDPSRPAVCIVRARSADGAETGRREVLVPPSQSKSVLVTTTVTSRRPPYVGDIYGCGLDVPGYLIAP